MKQQLDNYCLDYDIYKMCQHFSQRVINTNVDEYAKRKQSDIEKIENDILIGKLAEWGVYFIYLERNRNNIDPPDMKVYNVRNKSFEPDLKWGLYNLHIKSQIAESSERYGDSWVFQAKDPLFGFSNEYDIVIGCRVSIEKDGVYVGILLEKQFKELKFGEPKLSKFGGNKKVVYLKDNNE